MLTKIEEMICFAAIVETGSITAAAKQLNRSKAHISRKLNDLEKRYKIKLFHRSTRSLRLTDAGYKLQHKATNLLSDHRMLQQSAQHIQSDISGDFSISVNDSFAIFLLKPILPKLFNLFPDINFNINVTNKPVDLIAEKIDLAVRVGNVIDQNLVAKPIGHMIEKLYCNYNAASGFELMSLSDYHFIVNPYSIDKQEFSIFNDKQSLKIKPKSFNIINRYQIILDILPNSPDVAILPEFATHEKINNQEIVNIFPHWHVSHLPIYLIHPYHSPVPKKLALISSFLNDNLITKIA